MRHVDLCSGIGGFALGFEWAELSKPVLFCDIEPWSREILRKHWPDVPIADDVKELANDPDGLVPDCDILTAGYPCQPFSLAGERRGTEDDRHIWPFILAIVQAKRPAWCVFENVYGHVSMGLDEVLSDLEAEGYQARCFVIPAVAADARHRRDRCWIVGYSELNGSSAAAVRGEPQEDGGRSSEGQGVAEQPQGTGRPRDGQEVARGARAKTVGDAENVRRSVRQDTEREGSKDQQDKPKSGIRGEPIRSDKNVPNADSQRLQGVGQKRDNEGSAGLRSGEARWQKSFWEPEPAICRVANGVSGRVHRLKQLGNSIVPQVAARILWAIKEAHNG